MFDVYIENFYLNGEYITTRTKMQSVPASKIDGIQLTKPTVSVSMTDAGVVEFAMEKNSKWYNSLRQIKTKISIEYDGVEIFNGRVLTINNTLFGNRKIKCEGAFTFLLDSMYPAVESKNAKEIELNDYLNRLIDNHNQSVGQNSGKNFELGEVPGNYSSAITEQQQIKNEKRKYEKSSWTTTKANLEELKSQFGGTFRVRKGANNYILDWIKGYYSSSINTQIVEIGRNIIDLSSVTEINNIFTVLIPIGRTAKGSPMYIKGYREDVHGDNNYIQVPDIAKVYTDEQLNTVYHSADDYKNAISNYGIIYKTVSFEDAKNQEDLFNKAVEWIKDSYHGGIDNFTVRAIDLHIIGQSNSKILVGDRVQIRYPVSESNTETVPVTRELTCLSIKYDLFNPENTSYTFGIPSDLLNGTQANSRSIKSNASSPYSKPEHDDVEAEKDWVASVRKWLLHHKIYYNGPKPYQESYGDKNQSGDYFYNVTEVYHRMMLHRAYQLSSSIYSWYINPVAEDITDEVEVDLTAAIVLKFQLPGYILHTYGIDITKDLENPMPDIIPTREGNIEIWKKSALGPTLAGAFTAMDGLQFYEYSDLKSKLSAGFSPSGLDLYDVVSGYKQLELRDGNINLRKTDSGGEPKISATLNSDIFRFLNPDTGDKTVEISNNGNVETAGDVDVDGEIKVEGGIESKGDVIAPNIRDLELKWVKTDSEIGMVIEEDPQTGDKKIRAAEIVLAINEDQSTEARINADHVSIGSGQTQTVLTTALNSINNVVGEFKIETDPETGERRVVIQSGGGVKVLRDNVEFGLYDSGNLTGGIVVNKINDVGTVTKIRGDRVEISTNDDFSSLVIDHEGLVHTVGDNTTNISTLTNSVDGLTSTVRDQDGQISTLSNSVSGLRSEVQNQNGKISILTNTVDGLTSTVSAQGGRVSTLSNTVNGLTNTVENQSGQISRLTNSVDGLTSTVSTQDDKISTLSNTVTGLKSTVKEQGGQISTLSNTIDGFEAKLENVVDENGNVTAASIATAINSQGQAGVKLSGNWVDIEASQVRIGSQDNLNTWLNSADAEFLEIDGDINTLNGLVAEKATIGELNTVKARVSTIEAGYITAEQVTADLINSRFAESGIFTSYLVSSNNVWANNIYFKGDSPSDLVSVKNAIKELDVVYDDAKELYVLRKKSYSDSDWVDVATFSRAASGTISLRGTWSGNAKYTISAVSRSMVIVSKTIGFTQDSDVLLTLATNGSPAISATNPKWLDVPLKIYETVGTSTEDRYTVTVPVNSTVMWESGEATGITEGQNAVTITKGSWNNGVIQFTKSAGTESTKTVQLTYGNPSWDGNTASVVIWDGTAADTSHGVSTDYTVSVDASGRYSAGQTAAGLELDTENHKVKRSLSSATKEYTVSVSYSGWSNGKNTFSAKLGSTTVNSYEATMPSVTFDVGTWSSNKATVTAKHGDYTAGSTTVDASSVYSAGQTAAGLTLDTENHKVKRSLSSTTKEYAVAVSNSGWSNGKNTFSAKLGSTAVNSYEATMPSVTLTVGTWSSNKATVTAKHGTYEAGSTTVDASEIYSAGQDSMGLILDYTTDNHKIKCGVSSTKELVVRVSNGAWTNGKCKFYAVVGQSIFDTYEATMPSVTFSNGSWSSNKITVTAKHGDYTAGSTTVDASSIYSNGQTAAGLELDTTNHKVKRSLSSTTKEYAVAVSNSGWSNGKNTFSAKLGSTAVNSYEATMPSVTLTVGTWSSNKATVTAKHGSYEAGSTTVDASGIYTNGQNAVTLTDPSWNSLTTLTSSRTVTVSTTGRPTNLSKSKTVHITVGSWSSGSIPIYIRDGSNTGTIVAQNSVSMPAVSSTTWTNTTGRTWRADLTIGGVTRSSSTKNFDSYYTDGQNNITITKGSWSGGKISFTKSAGTASTKSVQLTAASPTWDGNTASVVIWDGTAADTSHGVTTGYTVSVNAKARYDAGVTAGKNAVTITKGSWSSGVISFTKSEGTASTKTVQLTAASPTWDGNTASVVIWDGTAADTSHGVTTGYTVSVNAKARYDAGVTAGKNAVTITKGSWSSGVISFTKSEGTASTKTVQLTAAAATWSGNTASVVIWDGTAADTSHGVSTGYTVSVNASARYTAGQNAVTLVDPSWNSLTTLTSSRTVTVSTTGRPTNLSKSKTVHLTVGSWSSGSIPIYIRDGSNTGTIVAQNSVSMPAVSSTTWTNTTGRTWRADLTIGGVTRSSSTKNFDSYYTDGQSSVTVDLIDNEGGYNNQNYSYWWSNEESGWYINPSIHARASNGNYLTTRILLRMQNFADYMWLEGVRYGWDLYYNDANWGFVEDTGEVYRPTSPYGTGGHVTWFNVTDFGYSKGGGSTTVSYKDSGTVGNSNNLPSGTKKQFNGIKTAIVNGRTTQGYTYARLTINGSYYVIYWTNNGNGWTS